MKQDSIMQGDISGMAAAPVFALSIVVPVYNGATSVPTLVEALAKLEVPGGHEIVLVNDCSPDNSLDVCRELCRQNAVALTVVSALGVVAS